MFYNLGQFLQQYNIPGIGVFQYISFRAALAIITSLIISMILGKQLIRRLRKLQIGEDIRDLGLEGQMQKKGTPTMGGIIILAAIIIPTLLFAQINNIYVMLMLITTVWLGTIGFIDDYIKVFKKDKKGLAGKFKIIGQITLGLIIGITLYLSPDVVIRDQQAISGAGITEQITTQTTINGEVSSNTTTIMKHAFKKSTETTIPFLKRNNFNYSWLVSFAGEHIQLLAWIVYILAIIFIITAVSNGANLTDGLDGLATGSSAIIGVVLGILAYISGHVEFAQYLNIMYIPNTQELVIFIGAFIGATVGFLWYNAYPAQVFMGDTGSLPLGGIIAVFAIMIRKELLLPILCGVFFIESISVVIQVIAFKYTKKKSGVGRRIFLMTPIHHHFQLLNIPESKIVSRFWILGIILAVLTIVTLKLR